jgi:hypothetical protein
LLKCEPEKDYEAKAELISNNHGAMADRIINPHPPPIEDPLGPPPLEFPHILSEFLTSPVEFPQIFIEF